MHMFRLFSLKISDSFVHILFDSRTALVQSDVATAISTGYHLFQLLGPLLTKQALPESGVRGTNQYDAY